jgi:hypothetical protein
MVTRTRLNVTFLSMFLVLLLLLSYYEAGNDNFMKLYFNTNKSHLVSMSRELRVLTDTTFHTQTVKLQLC